MAKSEPLGASRSRARSRLRVFPLLLLALPLAGIQCPAPAPGSHVFAIALDAQAGAWERFETVGNVWGPYQNRFDPDDVALFGEFRAPGGQVVRVPGFSTREYARRLVGGFEKLDATIGPFWSVRFTPTEPGTWSWRWVTTGASGGAETGWQEFSVTPAAAGRHGFLRRSSLDGRYLAFDDGTPFLAIGENMAWYGGGGTFDYDDWFAKLEAHGANTVRLWMPSWAFSIEWGGPLGDYGHRLDRAWKLDTVLDAAERHGIYVILCIQNHGPFSLDTNSEWDGNPYNAALGGPLAQPADFFTNAAARELFRKRLRYVVARWGYSTHIIAWELWNEVNFVALGPAVDAWHVEMANELDRLDPNDHLISTSVGNLALTSLWTLPEIDFVQLHHYAFPLWLDMPRIIELLMGQQAGQAPGKPRLLAEFGSDYRGPAETRANDPEGIGFHHGLWIGLMAGGFGTGLSWWWDNVIDPDDLYFHFDAIGVLTAGIAFDAQAFAPEKPPVSAAGRNLAAYALRGQTAVLAWVQNVDHQWFPPVTGLDPSPVAGGVLELSGLASDGVWTARWIDPYTALDVVVEDVTVAGGAVSVPVPTFAKDVALRLER